MKILAVFDAYPYPISHGQNLRVFHYAKHLSRRHEVDLVHMGDAFPDSVLGGLFRRTVAITDWGYESPDTRWRRLRDAFAIERIAPSSAQLAECVRELHREDPFDVLWVGASTLVPSLPGDLNVPMLVDECDHEGVVFRRRLALERSPTAWLRLYKRYQMRLAFERRVFRRAQAALFVSGLDAESFSRNCPQIPAHVIANGVDVEFFSPVEAVPVKGEMVFEGNMSFPPNVDAAGYFVREILPLVQAQVPGAHFTIIGKDPVAEVQGLASPSVSVTGFVEDVRPHLGRGQVFVCPMRRGAGIKNKLLQAWAMGLPVVSTPEGVGGLAARDGINVLLGASPQAFAEAVVALLTEDSRRATLGAAGRQTVLEEYTWEQRGNELEALLSSLVQATRP